MSKMKAGLHPNGDFCPIIFHHQIQSGEICTFDTEHSHVIGVIHARDNLIEFAFWDEAGLACPGGATYEEAVQSFDNYCKYCLGDV